MMISIVTVVRNGESTIADTLASVAAQQGPLYEHIIVDGASTDGTLEIVERFRTDRMSVISEPDKGIYDAMSKGLRMASGDFLGFLNADDFFSRTDALALIAAAIEASPDIDAIAGGLVLVQRDMVEKRLRSVTSRGYHPWMATLGLMVPHPAVYVRRTSAQTTGPFDSSLKIAGDFDWFLRFFHTHGFKLKTIEETLVVQREGGVSTSGFSAMRLGNAEISRALKKNGIASSPFLVWAKYLFKAKQLVARPKGFPPPAQVRFIPGE